jgi:hypothetical protein
MAYHELGVRTTNVTTGQAVVELIGATALRARLIEIGFTLVTAVATQLGLGRPAAAGITPTSPVTLLAEDINDAAPVSKTALAWGTSPTAPTAFLRKFTGSAIGQGAIWTFPKGIVLAITGASNSLTLHNILGGATLDVYVVVEE